MNYPDDKLLDRLIDHEARLSRLELQVKQEQPRTFLNPSLEARLAVLEEFHSAPSHSATEPKKTEEKQIEEQPKPAPEPAHAVHEEHPIRDKLIDLAMSKLVAPLLTAVLAVATFYLNSLTGGDNVKENNNRPVAVQPAPER